MIPAGPGELFDRISILKLKCERIGTPGLAEELEQLLSIAHAAGMKPEDDELFPSLMAANTKLWDSEEEIRTHLRTRSFGERFTLLARVICETNDERLLIKQRLNRKYGGSLQDVRSYPLEPDPKS